MRRCRPTPTAARWIGALLLGCAACAPDGEDRGGTRRPGVDDRAGPPDSSLVVDEVQAMLGASAGAWNAGDLEGFLDDYTRDPPLTFVGASGVIRGVDALRTRYRSAYWSRGGPSDSLRFEDVEVRPLGQGHAVALGRYVLYRPEEAGEETGTGFFTLVLVRDEEEGAWRILHDHSSAASEPAEDREEGSGSGSGAAGHAREAVGGSPQGSSSR